MQYPELATVQARLTYRLTSFLLENLAAGYTVEWMDAFHAQRHAAEALGIADRELPWLGTRVDPRGYKSFGLRMSRKIICGDCGRPFGHKIWHSGTPNRVDVWELPHELRQAWHLRYHPPLPSGTAGQDGRSVAGARRTQQDGGRHGRGQPKRDRCAATPVNAPRRDRQAPDRATDATHPPHPGLPRHV